MLSNGKPNVIIIYADDLGYGDLSCYGGVGVETPNIDRLLKNRIKFTCTSLLDHCAEVSIANLMVVPEYPLSSLGLHILNLKHLQRL